MLYPHDYVVAYLKQWCKAWCFQTESGEEVRDDGTTYIHYQGRFSLKVKARMPPSGLEPAHFSPTSRANRDNNFYVTKEETRVMGPWQDTDVPETVMPLQYRFPADGGYYPWQRKIIDINRAFDARKINILFDPRGKRGKTFLAARESVLGKARFVVHVGEYRDVMRMIMDTPKVRTYFINVPKAMSDKAKADLYAAMETIKDGYAYDDRYKYREEWFDSPNIWVFTNTMPKVELLSNDRWRYWRIQNDNLMEIDSAGQDIAVPETPPPSPVPIVMEPAEEEAQDVYTVVSSSSDDDEGMTESEDGEVVTARLTHDGMPLVGTFDAWLAAQQLARISQTDDYWVEDAEGRIPLTPHNRAYDRPMESDDE